VYLVYFVVHKDNVKEVLQLPQHKINC